MIRSKFFTAISLLSSLALVVTLAPASKSATYFPAETKFWVDCSLGSRTTDCIESVEFADPASEKKDANGQLDYSSLVWKKATVRLNKNFVYKETSPDLSKWGTGAYGPDFCESIPPNGEFVHDGCYTASGLLPDGKDLLFRLMVNGQSESFEIYQWVDQGVERTWDRQDGWQAKTVPDGSTWRITFKSDALAKDIGTIAANMKNPLVLFSKGSDGITRTQIQGTVYPNQYGCQVPGRVFNPQDNPMETCKIADTYAQTASTGFSIYLSPYIYQFEKLKGYPAGGIFVTGPTGHLGQVQYDEKEGAIIVPMHGPHYLFDRKTLNKGWMEVSIKGDVIRKAFNLEPSQAGQIARVEISYESGKSDVATYNSRYLKDLDVFEIRAYNFGFSAPTVTLKLPPAKKSGESSSASGPGSGSGNATSKLATITCVKGKLKKQVTGKSPRCPKGYTVKR